MRKIRTGIAFMVTLGLLLCFQNCGKFASTKLNSTKLDFGSSSEVVPLTLDPSSPLNVNVQDANLIQAQKAVIPIVLNKSDADPVTVTYQTSDGTAKEGLNYQKMSSTITIPPGQTSANVLVPILARDAANDLIFTVTITQVSKGTIGRATGRFVIPKNPPGPPPSLPALACGIQSSTTTLAFCERFDKASPVTGRSGQLDQQLWNVSRALGGGINIGMPFAWANTQLDACGSLVSVNSPNDVQICNGQLRESMNDNISGVDQGGSLGLLSMQPKQAFDFAGRTGTIAFDVSNDTAGTHAAWPEFWLTDQLVPTNFTQFGAWASLSPNALGIRFAYYTPANQYGSCPTSDPNRRFTVSSAVAVRNWYFEDKFIGGASQCNVFTPGNAGCVNAGMNVQVLDCVKQPSGPNGGLNHIELRISQNRTDVYATDAGTTSPLKHIAVVTYADLKFSRGYVGLADVHYNADKGPTEILTQRTHTFSWDNVAFDGPVIARERAFDVLDSRSPAAGGQYLGYSATPSSPAVLSTLSIPTADLASAKSAALQFNYFTYTAPSNFTYKLNNGLTHTVPAPFPYRMDFATNTISIPVSLTELISGANQVILYSDQGMILANISLTLAGAGGIVVPN